MRATRTTKRRKLGQGAGVTRLQAYSAIAGVLGLIAGGLYLYDRERRLNSARDLEEYRLDGERESRMTPAERETRRIAREEAERAQRH